MDLPSVKIRRILYATDLSENARIAFTYAVSLAEQYDAQIVILHALLEAYDLAIAYIGKAEWEKIKQEYYRKAQNILIGKRNECSAIKAALRKFADNAQKENGLKSVDDDEIIVEYGNPVEKILTVSEEKKCDLIVMGTHGTGSIMDAMMGSTTTRVLRRSKIPVMVIRLPEYIRKRFLSKVLSTIDIQKESYKTPFDYSQCARCGINVADRLCQKVDGKFPNGCPTNNSTQVIKAALDEMQKSGAFDFARQSTIQEGEGYGDSGCQYYFKASCKPWN